jgi:hypothetical protein
MTGHKIAILWRGDAEARRTATPQNNRFHRIFEEMAALGVRREKAALSSGCEAHPAKSLQPEAIGAVMEVTKWLKPSISGHNW